MPGNRVVMGVNCPRCGKQNAPSAAFCMYCGQQMQAPAPQAPLRTVTLPPGQVPTAAGAGSMSQAYDQQQRTKRIAGAVIVALALIVALAVGLRASGLLGLSSGKNANVLDVQHGSNHKLLAQVGGNGGPVLNATAENVEMPADVYDWLKHLEKCEDMKIEISGDQAAEVTTLLQKMQTLGAGMGMMDPYDQSSDNDGDKEPSGYAKGKILDLRPRWQGLITFFLSKAPPEECRPLADDYYRAVNEIPGKMGDLGDILNAAASDPQEALKRVEKMKNSSNSGIDRYFNRADEKLGGICSKYKKSKWFNIKADVLPGGVFGKMGLTP